MGKGGFPGPDAVEIDWEQVRKLCQLQCTKDEVADWFDISTRTVERCCERKFEKTFTELRDQWKLGGHVSLRRYQWTLAQKNAAMAIFLGKQYLEQRDESYASHSGNVGFNIVHYGDSEPKQWKNPDTLSSATETKCQEPTPEPSDG